MESLDNTDWDVLIVGTGLQQSILALALSRSGKNILHVDANPYYSGAAASFSIKEAEEWVTQVNEGSFQAAFADASIYEAPSDSGTLAPSQSRGRQYNLALAPEIIYSGSAFRRYLVSSHAYHSLQFAPVGGWWVYTQDGHDPTSSAGKGTLKKVPNTREDMFGDTTLSFPAKRKLIKFLRFVMDYDGEEGMPQWEEHRALPFSTFLSDVFKTPQDIQAPLLALTMSGKNPGDMTTEFALPRIARHLRSIGSLGQFSALSPRYGGLDEFCQTACRQCAVGGGTYVLEKGLSTAGGTVSLVEAPAQNPGAVDQQEKGPRIKVLLADGEPVTTRWIVSESSTREEQESLCKSISIISSPLETLFPPVHSRDQQFQSGSAVLVFPSGSLSMPSMEQLGDVPPVHIQAHSSESGDCPSGRSVLYASTSLTGESGRELLKHAVSCLLAGVDASPAPTVLWSLQYEQRAMPSTAALSLPEGAEAHALGLNPMSLDLAVDDSVFDQVRDVWQKITGDDPSQFLVFESREDYDDD